MYIIFIFFFMFISSPRKKYYVPINANIIIYIRSTIFYWWNCMDCYILHAPPFHYAPLFWCYAPFSTILLHFMTRVQFSARYPDIGVYCIMIVCFAFFAFTWILFTLQYILEFIGKFESDFSIILCDKLDDDNNKKHKTS